jgi:hypothetical protein
MPGFSISGGNLGDFFQGQNGEFLAILWGFLKGVVRSVVGF